MTPLEEARELVKRIGKAKWEMGGILGARGFQEDEVKFRIESIMGILIMAMNDAQVLVKEWERLEEEGT